MNPRAGLAAAGEIDLHMPHINVVADSREDVTEDPAHLPAALGRLLAVNRRIDARTRLLFAGQRIEAVDVYSAVEIRRPTGSDDQNVIFNKDAALSSSLRTGFRLVPLITILVISADNQ